jgi:hypothetical protein
MSVRTGIMNQRRRRAVLIFETRVQGMIRGEKKETPVPRPEETGNAHQPKKSKERRDNPLKGPNPGPCNLALF